MGMAGMTTEERLWETKLQSMSDKIDNLGVSVSRDMTHLADNIKSNFTSINKMIDDHEARLRKQTDMDSAQGAEISNLRVEMADVKAELRSINSKLEARVAKENDELKRLLLKAIEYILVGGAGAGAAYAVNAARLAKIF